MTAAVVKQGVEIAMPSSRRQNERSGGGGCGRYPAAVSMVPERRLVERGKGTVCRRSAQAGYVDM